MDSFCEYLVKMRHTLKSYLALTLIWLTAFALIFIVVLMTLKNPSMMGIVVIAVAGIFYGAVKLAQRFDIEYEMIAVNKDLDIDKIIAKSSRKRMITVHLDKVEEYGKYTPENTAALNNMNFNFKIKCANADDEAEYIVYRHPKKGLSLVIFAVNEELSTELKKYIPKTLIRK